MGSGAALKALMGERILVLDGAWGTMFQQSGLEPADYRGARFADHPVEVAGDPDLLNLTRPDLVSGIHWAYLAAGADVTTTNTFTATRIGQADYGLEDVVYELNVEGARLARAACDEVGTVEWPRFVAGSVGPLNVTLSMSARVDDPSFRSASFDQVRDGYAEQIQGLVDGGVDLLLLETVFDTLNAKAALVAAREVAPSVPLVVSLTVVDRSGRTLSGQTVEAFWASIEHAGLLAVAINCSLGGREMRPWLAELARVAAVPVWCYPNAGLPNAFGGYDESPVETAALLHEFAASGLVNGVGGCCGTTPDHIEAIGGAVAGLLPRSVPALRRVPRWAGLEPFAVEPETGFVLAGERTNVTGSARFRRLIEADDYTGAVDVALEQVRGGANVLDVNMDEGMLDSEAAMTRFLNQIGRAHV